MSRRGHLGQRAPNAAPGHGPGASRWTVLGAVGAPGAMAVDTTGRIVTGRVGWSFDWEVMAGEHPGVAGSETPVRQRAADAGGPVPAGLESLLRTEHGDVSQTAYVGVAPTSGAGAVGVVDVRNGATAPVAVRLTLRPGDFWRPDGLWKLQADAAGVLVNGEWALRWERPPSEVQLVADISTTERDPGGTTPRRLHRVRSRRGRAAARLTWPVTHGTALRVLLPLWSGDPESPEPQGVPTLEQVSRGWDVHTARGLHVGGLGGRIDAVAAATVRRLLALDVDAGRRAGVDGSFSSGERALIAVALAVAGFPMPAANAVTARASRDPGALARLARTEAVRRTGPWGGGAAAIGAMAASAGVGGGWSSRDSGDDPLSGAAFLLGLRDVLVSQGGDHLDLLPEGVLMADLTGAPLVEVHGLGTGCGTVSFAVRWHSGTPALLWEVAPPRTPLESWAAALAGSGDGERSGVPPRGPRLTASGLAETWHTEELTGESLLRA